MLPITTPSFPPQDSPVVRCPDPEIEACIGLLAEAFPKCFVVYEARRRPLKVGIHNDIMAALDGAVTAAELSRALGKYTNNKVYRTRLRVGAMRIDLNGEAAGTVAADEVWPGIKRVKAPPHPTSSAPLPTPTPLKRITLSGLREAGRQRREGGAS